MKQFKILDVKINKITEKEVLEKIKDFLSSKNQHQLVTLNPEMVVEAQKNSYFKKIVNNASLVIPDGVGVIFANYFLNRQLLSRKITGIDLIYKICESKFIKNKKIYLLGAEDGVAKKTAKVLAQKYDYLNIVGAEEGFKKNQQKKIFNDNLLQQINLTKPEIIFVAFGVPKQEEWIYENLEKLPTVRLALGIGGAFDFISGKIRRAPKIIQKLGLEWFWRLLLEPQRIKRVYNATFKFGWLVFKKIK